MTLPPIYHALRQKVFQFLDEEVEDKTLQSVQKRVRESIEIIEEALRRYTSEQLSISYNGGKDCLVLLVLVLACLPSSSFDSTLTSESNNHNMIHSHSKPKTLQAVYIASHHPFPEQEEFINTSAAYYHLDLTRYDVAMRPALEAYLEKTSVKAIFMGTRRTDPHGEFLTPFDKTDPGWPQFMRINVMLSWTYVEIWAFIRYLEIPFCSLYNKGFTSLGSMNDTHPNPALLVHNSGISNGTSTKVFRPAYELTDDFQERLGRDR